jgi:hypothetical protein
VPTLVVPGVRVETHFDILPPPLAPSGIIGAVGVVDRPPASGLVSIGSVSDMRSVLGPGTEIAMPEIVHALRNGASEVVVSAVGGSTAKAASATLLNADSTRVIILRTRVKRDWNSTLRVEVQEVLGADGKVARVTLQLLRDHAVVEEFSNLVVKPGDPNDFFATINSTSRYVVAVAAAFDGEEPQADTYSLQTADGTVTVPDSGGKPILRLTPAPRVSTTGLSVKLTAESDGTITAQVLQNGVQETFSGLNMDPDSDGFLPSVLADGSRFIQAQLLPSVTDPGKTLPVPPVGDAGVLTGGASPTVDDYNTAIDLLTDDTRIDTLIATLEPNRSDADVSSIHQTLAAQASTMADKGAPCIAYGSITANENAPGPNRIASIRAHAAAVHSRRFVLVSPPGAAGAVAGTIARFDPQDSPTFKSTPLFEVAPASYRETELNVLLGSTINLCVVQNRTGHGVVVLRGLDTSGDQISVTRVADEAIRETKAICENFIGVLNNDNARTALRQQLIATFTRMASEGALVPSTDGSSPPFLVSVHSTETDFDQGIVRVDIAVRPVRSIDYVYASIEVQG